MATKNQKKVAGNARAPSALAREYVLFMLPKVTTVLTTLASALLI